MALLSIGNKPIEFLSIYSDCDHEKDFNQWDKDRKLVISGVDFTTDCEVHFIVPDTEMVLTSDAYMSDDKLICDVPNILLQVDCKFTAYLYVNDKYGKRTKYKSEFKVDGRPKPSDYVYDEEEIKDYQKLENRIDGITGIVSDLEKRAEHLIANDGITLQDRDTGKAYIIYVSNGEVHIKESSADGGE